MKMSVYAPLIFLIATLVLDAVSIVTKSMFVIAGTTGAVVAWFLCIDKLISATQLSVAAKVLFITAIVFVPVFITAAMG